MSPISKRMGFFTSLFHKPLGFALDFSDSAVHLLEVRGRGANDVTASGRFEIPAGIVEDGRILDQAKLADVIRRAHAEAVPRPPITNRVVACLPESQTYITRFAIDRTVAQKDLEQAIADRGAQILPVNLDDHAWDHQILATTESSYEILFAATPADLVETYEQTLGLAGLKLEVLEPESMALLRALVEPAKFAKDVAVLVFDIGGRTSTMAFVDALGLQLSVTVSIAGHAMTDAVSKKLKISLAEAEKRKVKKGFTDKDCVDAMRNAINPLLEEATRARTYYEKTSGRKVQRMIVAGGSSVLPGIDAEFEKAMGVPVEKGASPYNVRGFESRQIAVPAGLALRATNLEQGINFIVP